jgi:hypothetical protein
MSAINCVIKCKCGGTVCQVAEDGTWYTLTERSTIVFRGICSDCEQLVRVEREITTLLLLCPTGADQHVN